MFLLRGANAGDNWGAACNVPAGLSNVVHIDAGYAHTCAVKKNGKLVWFGE